MVPTQLVQMPWGFYPPNFLPPQTAAPQQQPNQINNAQTRPPSGQRPLTPGQQQQAPQMPSGDGTHLQINAQQMPIQSNNVVDMNGKYIL